MEMFQIQVYTAWQQTNIMRQNIETAGHTMKDQWNNLKIKNSEYIENIIFLIFKFYSVSFLIMPHILPWLLFQLCKYKGKGWGGGGCSISPPAFTQYTHGSIWQLARYSRELGSHNCEKSGLITDAHSTFVPLAHNDNSFTTFVWSYLQNSVRLSERQSVSSSYAWLLGYYRH